MERQAAPKPIVFALALKAKLRVIVIQVEEVVIVNHCQPEFAQPALTTEKVARQIRILGKVDETFKDKRAGLENDFVPESIQRAANSIEHLWDALFNRHAECFAVFAFEETDCRARVNFRRDTDSLSVIAEKSGKADSGGIIFVADFLVEAELRRHVQKMKILSGSSTWVTNGKYAPSALAAA